MIQDFLTDGPPETNGIPEFSAFYGPKVKLAIHHEIDVWVSCLPLLIHSLTRV